MADLNVRSVALSLVDFAIANPASSRSDAIAHVETNHGWQTNNARELIQGIEERALDAGKIGTASWAQLRGAWVADGLQPSKRWVRRYVDTPDFHAQPGVQLALLREQKLELDGPIQTQNDIIAAAVSMVGTLTGDEREVAKLGRDSARGTKAVFTRARDAINAQIAGLGG